MWNINKLNKNIWKFYLYKILSSMFFSVPIIVLFWQDNWLSLTEIMILQSIFSILTVILEIPTWYFADTYGRKKTLIIAAITWLIAITSYSLWHNLYQFLFAEVFFALSVSFTSGTMSAFVYDTLLDLKRENEYKKIWWNILFYGLIALALANIIWWFVAKTDLRYTLYFSIPFFAAMIPLAFSMKEPHKHRIIAKKWYIKELLKNIINILKNKKLKRIIIYSGVIFAFNQSALWLYQPYFKISWLDIAYFWVVFASFQVVAAFSSKYAYKIEKKLWEKHSLIMLLILVTWSYFLMSNFVFLFSFSFCFIQQFVRWFKKVVITGYINQLTSSDIRATILSVENFVSRLFYAIVIPIFWWIADIYSLTQALTVIWITALVSWVIILIFLKKNKIV